MRKYVVRFMIFYILSIGCLLGIIIYSYQNKIDRHNEQVEIDVYKRQGRGIVIGRSKDGKKAVTAYFRSEEHTSELQVT